MIMTFEQTEGPVTVITMAGHAEHGDEPGHDIVCAGASALFVALCEAAGEAGAVAEYLDGSKAKRLRLYRTKKAVDYLQMFRAGMEALRREYPECVAAWGGEKKPPGF